MSRKPQQRAATADQTRTALVRAGLRLFGEHGFDATSTRALAAEANANIGSIAYHFGSKEGLRQACAAFIVDTMRAVAGSALDIAEQDAPNSADEARGQLTRALETLVGFIAARPEAGEIVQFILREMAHPTAALETIYTGVFEPVHERLCRVWAAATGEPADSERTRITVFTLIGQVVYFRIAREAVKWRMGWTEIGPAEAGAVIDVARDNLDAILAARTGRKP